MTDAAHESAAQHRGRVVMLVDNGVVNDSRVRKQAQSMAELGWEVVLIGRSPTQKVQRFKLGEAKVRLLPVQNTLARRRYEMRTGLGRGSLGYRTRRLAEYRQRQAEVRLYDTRLRRLELKQAADSGRSDLGTRLGLALTRASLARGIAEERWVRRRAEATERQISGDTPVDETAPKLAGVIGKVRGDRSWRTLEPHLWDFELAYRDTIDRLRPDLIHANDYAMVGVGARAALRARAAGRKMKFVYDAHEFVPGITRPTAHPWWLPGVVAYEKEYIRDADAVVTVSDVLADMLQETHGLPERPTVVLNAPQVGESALSEDAPRLRDLCGIDERTPLVIYSGGMAPQRGVQIMVEALPRLPEVHVGYIIADPEAAFVREIMERASALGVRDRVHLLPYVAPEHVVEYVSAADIGVHPTHHHLNHEISLATKFFEYSHARLPIVVSDVKTMAEMVRRSGQGEVFRAEDLDDYVRAIRAVLDNSHKYKAAYDKPGLLEEWTWRKQAKVLDEVYARLMRP